MFIGIPSLVSHWEAGISSLVAVAGVVGESSLIRIGVPWKCLTLSFPEAELMSIKLLFALTSVENLISSASADRKTTSWWERKIKCCCKFNKNYDYEKKFEWLEADLRLWSSFLVDRVGVHVWSMSWEYWCFVHRIQDRNVLEKRKHTEFRQRTKQTKVSYMEYLSQK